MEDRDEILRRVFAPPTPEEIELRRKAATDLLAHRVDIRPMTITDLRRLARTEDHLDDDGEDGKSA